MTKIRLFFILITLFVLSCQDPTDKEKSIQQPNIIVILCDDLGYADVGFNGSIDIKTPQLDALASNGTICSAAYVSHPFCGPSRTALMTGRYPHPIGAQFNLPRNNRIDPIGVPLSETFISKVLQDNGYYTGIIGKWHLGVTEKYHPNSRGFDEFYGFLGGGHNYFPNDYRAKYEQQKAAGVEPIFEYLLPLEHNGKEVQEKDYVTDALSREAVTFVKKAKEKDQPFFLYLSYNAPHVPLEAKEEDIAQYLHMENEDRKIYAAMVHAVDRGVGILVESLKEMGALDNTLIVFFSDNGGKTTKGANNFPLREGKGSTCEGGVRVPMFFHWPGKVPAGSIYEHPVLALDLYPTFAKLAGADVPENKVLDGKDIWKDFLKGENAHADEDIYVLRHREGYTDVGVRKNQWKALRINQDNWQLYNITDDISETRDLSSEYPEIMKELIKEGKKWSSTHKQPLWFHDQATGDEWKQNKMPHFDKTFEIDKNIK